jgi:hypothetical protein
MQQNRPDKRCDIIYQPSFLSGVPGRELNADREPGPHGVELPERTGSPRVAFRGEPAGVAARVPGRDWLATNASPKRLITTKTSLVSWI